jgi:hypothetical protein
LEEKQISSKLVQTEFKSKTNMPPTVRLQQDACVIYLNNSLLKKGICNETIGVITNLNKQQPSI